MNKVKVSRRIGLIMIVLFVLSCLFLSVSSCKRKTRLERPIVLDSNDPNLSEYKNKALKSADIFVLLSGVDGSVLFLVKDPDKFQDLTLSINNRHFKGSELEFDSYETADGIVISASDGAIDYRVKPGEVCLVTIKDKEKTILSKLIKVSESPRDLSINKSTTGTGYELIWTLEQRPTAYNISIEKSTIGEYEYHDLPGSMSNYRFTEEECLTFISENLEPVNSNNGSSLPGSIVTPFDEDESALESNRKYLKIELFAGAYYNYGKIVIATSATTTKVWRYAD